MFVLNVQDTKEANNARKSVPIITMLTTKLVRVKCAMMNVKNAADQVLTTVMTVKTLKFSMMVYQRRSITIQRFSTALQYVRPNTNTKFFQKLMIQKLVLTALQKYPYLEFLPACRHFWL